MRKTLSVVAMSLGATFALAATCGLWAADPLVPGGGKVVTIERCTVQLNSVDGVSEVPAQEAGVLMKINVREGQQVRSGAVMANIDDKQAKTQQKNAEAEWSGAREKSQSNIDIDLATKAAKVSEYEFLMDQQAARSVAKSVTDVELQQKKFAWEHMLIAIDQAKKQKTIDSYTADAKQAEMEMAQEAIERREIRSPIDGVVQEIRQHQGEWVKPGDTVVRVIRMNQLSVAGSLKSDAYNPGDLIDQPVKVQVMLPGGRTVDVPGKVVFVSSEVDVSGRFKVVAQVDNPNEKGQWLLRPGLPATMMIQTR
jgi:multidrug efflux pump subunit AcrA (membrane-fusion protein)